MDFAIRDYPGGRDRDVHSHRGQMRSPRVKGPICRARTRELDPVSDIHLIHHLVMEELDKVGVGDVEGGIFAMLAEEGIPRRGRVRFDRGCSQARSSDAIPLEGHVGLRRWYLRPLEAGTCLSGVQWGVRRTAFRRSGSATSEPTAVCCGRVAMRSRVFCPMANAAAIVFGRIS